VKTTGMIVIADDITGAAEIAGIAFSKGLQVGLVCGNNPTNRTDTSVPTAQITVIATDTRSMSECEAINETYRLAATLKGKRVFKKTDSALRGHVMAELKALMDITGCHRAVYVPANPSKGRIIRQGIYMIHGKPIHETDFSFDPEFPARTASLQERFPEAAAANILMPDAESLDDIQHMIATYDDGQTLFAGAADFFSTLCPTGTFQPQTTPAETMGSRIILCGSTQSKPIACDIPVFEMPLSVYDGDQEATAWLRIIPPDITSLILTIPHRHRTGKATATHLRSVMGEVTKGLVDRHCPDHLIIEGGATAWATLQALGWKHFTIESQIAPGVVQMRATNGTLVTLKPGSYPWGNLFQSFKE